MNPIVHPLWFYLIEIGQNIKAPLNVAAWIMLTIACGSIIWHWMEEEKTIINHKGMLIGGILLLSIAGLFPSKEACYQMMAASIVTPNNIEVVGDTATEIIDYIVDSVDKLLEENTVTIEEDN